MDTIQLNYMRVYREFKKNNYQSSPLDILPWIRKRHEARIKSEFERWYAHQISRLPSNEHSDSGPMKILRESEYKYPNSVKNVKTPVLINYTPAARKLLSPFKVERSKKSVRIDWSNWTNTKNFVIDIASKPEKIRDIIEKHQLLQDSRLFI